jgi:hypothetical protein
MLLGRHNPAANAKEPVLFNKKGLVMKNAALAMIATGLLTAPAQAADWSDARHGAFIGARLTIGGRTGGRPSAALTVAPTQNRISSNGMSTMRIGEGIALNLTPGAQPTLTLAGVRADQALGLGPSTDANAKRKLGISTGGWIAIGFGVAAVAGGAYALHVLEEADENSD